MWQPLGADRWTWNADEDRHLLLRNGDLLVELHAVTIHVYRAPAEPGAAPLEGARWLSTTELPAVAGADDENVWSYLEAAVATAGVTAE